MNKAVTGGAATTDFGPDEQDLLLTVLFRLDGADLAAFERYEAIVLPLLPAHGGVIERRIRTADDSIELHIVRFPDRAAFELYKSDDHRLAHAALLEQSGVTVEVHEGRELASASFAAAQAPPVEALDPRSTALLVIDVQHGFDDPCWGCRNNPAAEARIADLLAAWRAHAAPIYHAHHASTEPDSPLRPEVPGHAIKPEALPVGDEPVYLKQVNSAFIGTSLKTDLRSSDDKAPARPPRGRDRRTAVQSVPVRTHPDTARAPSAAPRRAHGGSGEPRAAVGRMGGLPRRGGRLLGGVFLVAATVTAVAFRPDLTARAVAGLAAHVLCSATFVSGLDPASTDREFVGLHVGARLARLLSFSVDRSHSSVTTSFAGTFGATASYHDGYGCRVDRPGDQPFPPLRHVEISPGSAEPGPVQPSVPMIEAALDVVFRERPGEPVKNAKAVVVMVDGRIVAERYAVGFGRRTPVLGYSVTKSVINALLGILVRQGRVRVDRPVGAPEWSSPGDPRAGITYEDLLRMRSGLDAPETGSGFDPATRMLFTEPDMAGFAARHGLAAQPGARWDYTSANTLILARAIGRIVGGGAAGMREFARRELFEPLGMDGVTMEFDGRGVFIGSSYAYAPARAFARFGMLYASDGMAPGGRRLLPPGWVDWSRRSTLGSPYGAGFWTNDGPSVEARGRVKLGFPAEGFFASGNFGQRIYVVPSRRLVLARFGYSGPPLFGLEDDIALVRAAMSSSPTRRSHAEAGIRQSGATTLEDF